MRRRHLPSAILLVFPWLTSLATGQVSRATQVVAPGAIQAIVPSSVGTAQLPGLVELGLPPGSKAFVSDNAATSLNGTPSSGTLFHPNQRDGKQVLVATDYEKTTNYYGVGTLKPTVERVYPAESKLVYTGPWVTGVAGMGFKHLELTGFAAYLMRPVEVTMRRVTPRPVAVAATTLKAGAIVPASSGQAIKITTSTVVQPQPAAQGCGVKFNPESLADPARLQGFVCLLLTQDGQGTMLPDGTKLFRRNGAIEHWKGDVVVERSGGIVTRDAAGRYWFLEFQGWL